MDSHVISGTVSKWQTLNRCVRDKPCPRPNIKPSGQGINMSVKIAMDILVDLNEDERMEIFNKFCKHCGSDNPNCQCWNDE
jgi:hypothetical protein